MNSLETSISAFDPISLQEMDGVALLNRTDTKFVFDRRKLPGLLLELSKDYRMLEIKGLRLNNYRTQYFDTADLRFYRDHHNGKKNRTKVRFREYVDSGIFFLEVKQKSNKGRTQKTRIRVPGFEDTISPESAEFLLKTIGKHIEIGPELNNTFKRLTLVHKFNEERFTIDLDLSFSSSSTSTLLPEVVIAELKQSRKSRNTDSAKLLHQLRIREMGFSKYCVGMALLRTDIKRNNFKEKTLFIEKLQKFA